MNLLNTKEEDKHMKEHNNFINSPTSHWQSETDLVTHTMQIKYFSTLDIKHS